MNKGKYSLDKKEYWDRLVDYYYDNVFDGEDPITPNIWLKIEYNAETFYDMDRIYFDDEKKFIWFKLRWGG